MAVKFPQLSIKMSTFEDAGDQDEMEDATYSQTVINNFSRRKSLLTAVMDGFGGPAAVTFIKEHLFKFIIEDTEFWDDSKVTAVLRKSISRVQVSMAKTRGFPVETGSCITVCVIRNTTMYIVHLGTSSIIVGFKGKSHKAILLTKPHVVSDKEERKNILAAGGQIDKYNGTDRVVWERPSLEAHHSTRSQTTRCAYTFVSRSLGVFWSLNPKTGRLMVSQEPDTCEFEIDLNVHKCIVLVSDGISDVLSPVNVVKHILDNELSFLDCPKHFKYYKHHARSVVMASLEKAWHNRQAAENMACIVLMLNEPTVDLKKTKLATIPIVLPGSSKESKKGFAQASEGK